jgi:HSP20 family molecular chaperone IbpA
LTFSTWKGTPTKPTEEGDPLEGELGGLARSAKDPDSGEIIETAGEVTFVMLAPGYSRMDIGVRAEEDRLRVEAYDFKMVKMLRCRVEPTTARSTYLNGVLSVKVAKRV